MQLKIAASLLAILLLVVGCTSDKEKAKDEPKQEQAKEQETNQPKQNKELTKQVKDEKGVLDGQVYTQDRTAIGTLVLDKKVSDEDAKKLAEKYAEELKDEYKDMKVNVQAVRDGKNVANITED